MNFEAARLKMVDNQIRTTDVTSHPVLDAFLTVPRERFVPERFRALAYIDNDIEILPADAGRRARYLMEPSPLAKLIQLADVRPGDSVLEIGCGTGYASAILSRLAASVTALECEELLADSARRTLAELGCANAEVVVGPLAEGWPAKAPFNVIFVGGAVEELPDALLDQLKDGGRLVVVEGVGNASRARLYVREDGAIAAHGAFNTSVRSLPGFERAETFVF
ncbi:MAG: protein-L-isoaspartate O-methyltransferase family protein [Pararhizobium sp.]